MLAKRIASVAIALPIVLGAVWLGGVAFTAFIAAASVICVWEFFGFASQRRNSPVFIAAMVLAPVIVAMTYFGTEAAVPLLTLGVVATLTVRLVTAPPAGALIDWPIAVAGLLYTGWLFRYYVLLRQLPDGLAWTLFTFLTTFAVDAAAYFVGSTLGKNQLAPLVSPKKSREGGIAGLILGAIAGAVLAIVLKLPVSLEAAVGIGLAVGVAAQLGDLIESMLKRSGQVKDAGQLLPGHGGLLDRADSLVIAGVVVYYLARWVAG